MPSYPGAGRRSPSRARHGAQHVTGPAKPPTVETTVAHRHRKEMDVRIDQPRHDGRTWKRQDLGAHAEAAPDFGG
jgi:hypothetical protein